MTAVLQLAKRDHPFFTTARGSLLVITGEVKHTFPSRTRSLSPQPPMVVQPRCCARVGRRQSIRSPRSSQRNEGFLRLGAPHARSPNEKLPPTQQARNLTRSQHSRKKIPDPSIPPRRKKIPRTAIRKKTARIHEKNPRRNLPSKRGNAPGGSRVFFSGFARALHEGESFDFIRDAPCAFAETEVAGKQSGACLAFSSESGFSAEIRGDFARGRRPRVSGAQRG